MSRHGGTAACRLAAPFGCSLNAPDHVSSFDWMSELSTSPLHLRLQSTDPCHCVAACISIKVRVFGAYSKVRTIRSTSRMLFSPRYSAERDGLANSRWLEPTPSIRQCSRVDSLGALRNNQLFSTGIYLHY